MKVSQKDEVLSSGHYIEGEREVSLGCNIRPTWGISVVI